MSDNVLSAEQFEQLKKVIQGVSLLIDSAEQQLNQAKLFLNNLNERGALLGDLGQLVEEVKSKYATAHTDHTSLQEHSSVSQVVYGVFDGYFMVGEDTKKYPVPVNYSSKSKLIPGDKLKLSITHNGQLLYKLIEPCERKHIKAVLSKTEDDANKFIALTTDGEVYNLNQAAVTFFKGHPGDEIYIIVNKYGTGNYAAIEAIVQ